MQLYQIDWPRTFIDSEDNNSDVEIDVTKSVLIDDDEHSSLKSSHKMRNVQPH